MRFQQLRCTLYHHVIYCGNTDITQTILFQRLGLSDVNARITAAANGTEYFLASFIAYYAIDYVGRRQLMLIGAIGQSIVMLLLAILGYINNGPAQIVSVVLLFGFNTFFAIGWLGMAWLYVSTATSVLIFLDLIFSLLISSVLSLPGSEPVHKQMH